MILYSSTLSLKQVMSGQHIIIWQSSLTIYYRNKNTKFIKIYCVWLDNTVCILIVYSYNKQKKRLAKMLESNVCHYEAGFTEILRGKMWLGVG